MKTYLTNLLATACAATALFCNTVQAAPIAGQGTWETTLQARDLNGDATTDAFYDTTLNITWLRDANVNGRATWDAATAWASSNSIGGISGWRLPTMVDTGAAGCDFSFAGGTDCGYNVQTRAGGVTYSEMAHLYYVTLGNLAYCPPGNASCSVVQAGSGLNNTANFQNFQ